MARGTSSRPTQKTIAESIGLAVTTVSRALQGDPKIAQATREQVARVAAEIGYVPDRAAQRLRTGKTRVVSLILNPHDEILGFGNSLISGLSQAMQGSDYHLTITPCFSGEDEMEPIERVVRNGLADGLVLTRTRNFDDRIRFLLEQKFPFICHGRTDFARPHSFVDFDNEAFAFRAVQRLVEKGCETVTIILPRETFTFHQHMRYGFMRAVSEHGIDYVIPDGLSLDSPASAMKAWATGLVADRRCQQGKAGAIGFVCPGEASYLALFAGFREQGFVRGPDYDVVIKSNSSILEQIDPDLDCIFEDIRDAGLQMGRALLSMLQTGPDEVHRIVQAPVSTFDQTGSGDR